MNCPYTLRNIGNDEVGISAWVILTTKFDDIPPVEQAKVRGWHIHNQTPYILAIFPCASIAEREEQEERARFLFTILQKQYDMTNKPSLKEDLLPKLDSELEKTTLLNRVASAL